MKTFWVVLAAAVLVLVVLIISCENEPGGAEFYVPPRPTATLGSPQQGIAIQRQFEVHFSGLMTHVFDTDGTGKDKTVILKSKEHSVVMYVPREIDDNVLKNDPFKFTVSGPSAGFVKVSGLDGWTIRVVGVQAGNVTGMTPPLDRSGADFKTQVPSLTKITWSTLNKNTMKQVLEKDTVEDAAFAAFFLLEGGKFTTVPYCNKTHFAVTEANEPDHEFAEDIILKGTVVGDVALQFQHATKQGRVVRFVSPPEKNRIRLEALPDPLEAPMSHIRLFKNLAQDPNGIQIDDVIPAQPCANKGPIPGCSNNQFP